MRYILCIIVTMSLGLLSCGGGKEDEPLLGSIERTWQLCETSLPDALARAEMLRDSVQASSEYVRHRYDLLTIRLRDKLDMIPSSPDSALQVVSYFENRPGAASDMERAYYYAGSAYRDLKDYPRAVCLFLKATDAAEQAGGADTLIWQNALSQLRFLYMMLLNYEEELNVALRSVKLSRQSGQNLGCYLMDVSSAYRHLNDTAQCLLYCDQAYNVIRGEHFPPRYGRILASMLLTYSDYNRYDKTGMLLRHLSQMGAEQRPHNYQLCLAKYYENRNQNDSAIAHYIIYYNTAEEATGRYEASAGLQRCYLQRKDYRSAAEWGQRLYATNDTITSLRAFEQTQRARDEYRYFRDKEAEQAIVQRNEAIARRSQHIIFVSVIVGLALLSLALGLVAYWAHRKKKFIEEIADKDRLLEQKARINKELTRIALMNIATDKADEVFSHFRDIATGKARLTDASWEGLTAAIETLYPEFLETVDGRTNKPLPESLLRTICLLKIGMKPAQIARVMDAKIQTVWNRVKRAEEICGDLFKAP